MNVKTVAGVIAVLAVLGIGVFAFTMNHGTSGKLIPAHTTAPSSANPQNTTNSSKVLFSSTPYAPYSYQIYPGPISQQAQAALAGFNITSSMLQNGSVKITISLLSIGQSQTTILKPNYKLYVIETTFGDDGYHFDSSFGDDGFMAVTPEGYIA